MSAAAQELAKLHHELVERRVRLLDEPKTVETDLAALARAAAIVDPDMELGARKRRGRPASAKIEVSFERGEFSGELLRVMREAKEPLNAREATEAILRAKGFSLDDVKAAPLTSKVAVLMKNYVERGRARRIDGGDYVRWEIAR